jgi:hypothetical protein
MFGLSPLLAARLRKGIRMAVAHGIHDMEARGQFLPAAGLVLSVSACSGPRAEPGPAGDHRSNRGHFEPGNVASPESPAVTNPYRPGDSRPWCVVVRSGRDSRADFDRGHRGWFGRVQRAAGCPGDRCLSIVHRRHLGVVLPEPLRGGPRDGGRAPRPPETVRRGGPPPDRAAGSRATRTRS